MRRRITRYWRKTIHDRRRFGSVRYVPKKTMSSTEPERVEYTWSGGVLQKLKYIIVTKHFIFQEPWNSMCAVFDIVWNKKTYK